MTYDTPERTVFGRWAPRHRHHGFLAFPDQIEAAVPVGKVDHGIMDGVTQKHPEGQT